LRALGEFASLPAALPLLWALSPQGDGHPVLVLPGLGAGDRSTRPLRRFLRHVGYQPSPWQQGRNLGFSPALYQGLETLLQELFHEHSRKVSLVGWSLGGLHAVRLAAARPEWVRQVITLGSPLGDSVPSAPARPFPVTAIYSRSDAIVPWRLSRVTSSRRSENLEVHGSHLGLGVNPSVFLAVADRLSQSEEDWQPFDRTGLRSVLFPNPERA
jgi:pimeloyl-ACP methyl ester carboxylesterase